MIIDPEIKVMEGVKVLPVFEKVQCQYPSKIDSLDEAVILIQNPATSKVGSSDTILISSQPRYSERPTQETRNAFSNPDFLASYADPERVVQLDQMLPVPLIPMGLAIIALLIAVTFVHV